MLDPYLVVALVLTCLTLLTILLFPIAIKLDKSTDELLVRAGDTKGQTTPGQAPRLKIPADCPETSDGFIVEFELPDRAIACIAIPADLERHRVHTEGCRLRAADDVFGLNLVCSGHYT